MKKGAPSASSNRCYKKERSARGLGRLFRQVLLCRRGGLRGVALLGLPPAEGLQLEGGQLLRFGPLSLRPIQPPPYVDLRLEMAFLGAVSL